MRLLNIEIFVYQKVLFNMYNCEEHSCMMCKHCRKRVNGKGKYYYLCNKTKEQITHSVFQKNSCLNYISKAK